MKTLTDSTIAYTIARIGLGVNLALHGLVRIPKLSTFAAWMTDSFKETWLPAPLVSAFAHALPFIELIVGLLILVGFLTRYALTAAGLLIVSLLFGVCLIENWDAAGTQMVYLAFICGTLALRERYNLISIDGRRRV